MKDPEFNLNLSSESSFTVALDLKDNCNEDFLDSKELDNENEYSEKFNSILKNLSNVHKKFPKFMIDIMAKDYKIPEAEITILINEFEKKGILIPLKNNYYEMKSEKTC